MRSIILVVHISLDGFVSGPHGELTYFSASDENLAFVNSLTVNADTALFGRNSYELLNGYWPAKYSDPKATAAEVAYSNWYNAAQKIVVSATLPETGESSVIIIRQDPETAIHSLKKKGGSNILIFGSPSLSQTLMNGGLIDEFWILIHPSFFGKGIPLFTSLNSKVDLKLLKTHVLPNGEIAMHYTKK